MTIKNIKWNFNHRLYALELIWYTYNMKMHKLAGGRMEYTIKTCSLEIFPFGTNKVTPRLMKYLSDFQIWFEDLNSLMRCFNIWLRPKTTRFDPTHLDTGKLWWNFEIPLIAILTVESWLQLGEDKLCKFIRKHIF